MIFLDIDTSGNSRNFILNFFNLATQFANTLEHSFDMRDTFGHSLDILVAASQVAKRFKTQGQKLETEEESNLYET